MIRTAVVRKVRPVVSVKSLLTTLLHFNAQPLRTFGIMVLLVITLCVVAFATQAQSARTLDWIEHNAAYSSTLQQLRGTIDELILAEHRYMISGDAQYFARSTLLRRQLNAGLDKLEAHGGNDTRLTRSFPRVDERYSGSIATPGGDGPRSAVARQPYQAQSITLVEATRGDSHALEVIEAQLESLYQAEWLTLKGHLVRQHRWYQKVITVSLTVTLAALILFLCLPLLWQRLAPRMFAQHARHAVRMRAQRAAFPAPLSGDADTAQRIAAARAEERANIARDVHDELGSLLMALLVDMKLSSKVPATPRRSLDGQWPVLMERVNAAMAAVSNLAERLRPSVIDQIGLLSAIEAHFRKFEQYTKLACKLDTRVGMDCPTGQAASDVFMIFQEALTNVARHADASAIHVRLDVKNTGLTLAITDDGKGIAPDQILSVHSAGIAGMSDRAQRNGGTLHIEGSPGNGTTLTLQLPLTLPL